MLITENFKYANIKYININKTIIYLKIVSFIIYGRITFDDYRTGKCKY